MKGIVFNLLEEVVSTHHSIDDWEAVLDVAGREGAYTAVGSYPDEEFMALVVAASARFGMPQDDLVRWFGRHALPLLRARYPEFFEPHASTPAFLLTLNDVIHPEVRKLFPGADVPEFDFETPDPDTVSLGYTSSRALCAFAEGLIEGAAATFGQVVEHRQTSCVKRGDAKCVIVCRFAPAKESAA